MFGYVVVNKPELKIREFEVYQSFYCGLCDALHKAYGRKGQLTLNFDLTFVAILLNGLYEPVTTTTTKRCIVHPLHPHLMVENDAIRYAADMTILLTILKCEDDWLDEHRRSAQAMQALLKGSKKRIEQTYGTKVEIIRKALAQGQELEHQQRIDLDALSACSGAMMAEIVTWKQDEWEETLRCFGDYLGRYIYILDAYDDVLEDERKGLFNPFHKQYQQPDFDERVKKILELLIAQSAEAFERLPILEHADILRNILYSGIWTKYELIRKKRSGEE